MRKHFAPLGSETCPVVNLMHQEPSAAPNLPAPEYLRQFAKILRETSPVFDLHAVRLESWAYRLESRNKDVSR